MRLPVLALLPLLALLPVPAVRAQAAGEQDLAGAIADALATAPALAEAQAGEAAARARLDRARTERNPLLRIEGSVGAGRIDNGGFFGLAADDVTAVGVQTTAELPLFAGGRIASAIAQARGGAQIALLQAEQARLQTIVGAVGSYVGVLGARRLEERFVRLAQALREAERQAGLRYAAGEIASSDLALSRARRAEAEAGLAEAEGRRRSVEAAFERLTGKAPGALRPLPPLPATPETLDAARERARAVNPALAQAEQGVLVARAGRRGAAAEGLPTVGAFAEAAHVRDQFFPGYRADSVAVGIRGRWTLFAGGRVAAQIRAADADLAAAEARERQTRLAIDGEVIDAWQALRTGGRVVAAARLRHAAAAEALRGTRLEAQVGARTMLALLDAEREAIEAEAALVAAEGMEQVAAWRLNALTGNIR